MVAIETPAAAGTELILVPVLGSGFDLNELLNQFLDFIQTLVKLTGFLEHLFLVEHGVLDTLEELIGGGGDGALSQSVLELLRGG